MDVGVETAVRGGVCWAAVEAVVDGDSGLDEPSLYLKEG